MKWDRVFSLWQRIQADLTKTIGKLSESSKVDHPPFCHEDNARRL